MKWSEAREKYPNQWVKLHILNSHEIDNKEYIDDIDVISVISNEEDATDELVNCEDKEIVYHTIREEIFSEIRNIFFSYRRGKH